MAQFQFLVCVAALVLRYVGARWNGAARRVRQVSHAMSKASEIHNFSFLMCKNVLASSYNIAELFNPLQ